MRLPRHCQALNWIEQVITVKMAVPWIFVQMWRRQQKERIRIMGLQDDRMSGNIQDIARLITRLLLQGDMPQYTLPAAEADYTEADHLFKKVIGLADEGDINGAENELLMNMEDDDPDYLELALTFYLYLNDMDGDYLDDHGYSREEVLDGVKSLAEDWGVTGLETLV